ncbi:conserved hypothetical protein [Verticillium alfalfae VaMs.102]|uniref:MARVEL domain-containing protein n=1 Tax=Verticillium alfalfae (strain VaMs.102 / ATCC MYA-4576 / FGSC 10136) TaxID=526221 RepID=C9SG99_VERA1|nr:conserved hypothetical protein [Verticillium alfalfae VaMs.102]EEY18113.1 conserved hypothetical protein [Verticillium alfalfae VaMs.102]
MAKGVALKFLQWFIRGVQFGCAAIVLGIFSYFLATLSNHNIHIATYVRAVTGISGAAVLYTILGLVLLCCLAGRIFTSAIAILLDLAFAGAFIYVAYANRHGASSCNGYVDTPYGRGRSAADVQGTDGFTNLPSFRQACRLQSACFAVSIIAIVFFLLSILVEVFLVRHHKKEKRFGPGPRQQLHLGLRRQEDPRLRRRPLRLAYNTEATAVAPGQDAHPYSHPKTEVGYGYTNGTGNGIANDHVVPPGTAYGVSNETHTHDAAYAQPLPQQTAGVHTGQTNPYRYEDGTFDRR